MGDVVSSETVTGMANRLREESVPFQRCLSAIIASRQLYAVAFAELQTLLADLPPGLSDEIPIEFSPEERALLTDQFSEMSVNKDPFLPETGELITVLGSYVLPWLSDVGLKRQIEAAKDRRYQHLASWKKRAETPIKLPFKLTIDAKTGTQCSRNRPLLFIVSEAQGKQFKNWFCRGLKAENKQCKLLTFSTPDFAGDIPFSAWSGKLHLRNFADNLRAYEHDDPGKMADVLFNPDLLAGQIERGSMSITTHIHELKQRTAQWARQWSVLSVSCVHMSDDTPEQKWQLTRLEWLRPYYTLVRVTAAPGGFRVGPFSDVIKAK